MSRSKVIINGETYMDLTGDNVTEADVAYGKLFHLPNGDAGVGSSTKDADTSDATLLDAEALNGKTFYKGGAKRTGAMVNNGAVTGIINTKDGEYTIPIGYHDGSGKVGISQTERNKIIGANIKAGVEILGETGTYTGEGVSAQTKTVTPTFTQQAILPDTGYDYLSQVTVNAIPVTEVVNETGGTTVTVG